MYEQNLKGIKSSPIIPSQHDNHNHDRSKIQRTTRETVAITVSAPIFFAGYAAHQYDNQDNKQKLSDDDDEKLDRKWGLFRNRLFSTWTGLVQANEKKVVERAEDCDILEWETKKEEEGKGRVQARDDADVKRIRSHRELSIDSVLSSSSSSSYQGKKVDVDIDGGYAWIILIVMFVINGSTFGTARAYGLIFENSARRDEQSRSEAALPFTIMGAIENMAGPLTGYLLARTGSWRLMVFAGSCLITLSHLMGAYFDSQSGQILTIGLMCGVGQSFISISSFQINNAYFVRYRSRAFGIGLTGAALGTFYISPMCQYMLDNHTKGLCYLMLGFILLPNVFLSLLLKPKGTAIQLTGGCTNDNDIDNELISDDKKRFEDNSKEVSATLTAAVAAVAAETTATLSTTAVIKKKQQSKRRSFVFSISSSQLLSETKNATELFEAKFLKQELSNNNRDKEGFWKKVNQVVSTPVFHLIWPTQLMFCWLNFVFGMIITDFGKDRGLNDTQNSHLIIIWASGQLFGRLCLGSLIDLQILSHKSFTIICFASISSITFMLNNFGQVAGGSESASNMICLLVFILSMFISTLYILFNGLVVNYMDKSLTALSIGISSFTGSFFLLPRANIIGYYRDTCGNYDSMLTMFTYVTLISALLWLIMPCAMCCSYIGQQTSGTLSPPNHEISNQGRPRVEKFSTIDIAEHLSKAGNK